MTDERVRVSGEARVSRVADGATADGIVTLDVLLEARDALVRIGSLSGGLSELRAFRHPVSLWTLREIDSAIEATLHANRSIVPRFKDAPAQATRSVDQLPPPVGYQWCPACLGCLEWSQTCPVCDGDRVVRADH